MAHTLSISLLLIVASCDQPHNSQQTATASGQTQRTGVTNVARSVDETGGTESAKGGVSNPTADERTAKATEVIATLTKILAAVGVIQMLIYAIALRTTHRVERAYVLPTGMISDFETTFVVGTKPSLGVEFKNYGKTPARIVGFNSGLWSKPLPKLNPMRKYVKPFPAWLASDQTHFFAATPREPLSQSEYDNAINATPPMYLIGRIVYRHQFQLWFTPSQYTDFCLKLGQREDPNTSPGTSVVGFEMVPDGFNKAT
jgi:hypothetical protein